jgi:thiol-disulfide isomerase/thioredoxin
MRRLLYQLLVFIFVSSCETNGDSYKLIGEFDSEIDTKIYLIEADSNNQPIIIDSTSSKNGSFEFKRDVFIPNINFLRVDGLNFPFVSEQGTIKIRLFKDSLLSSIALGTNSNNNFMEYKSTTKTFDKSLNSIINEIQQASILKDPILYTDLQEQYSEVRGRVKDFELNFIKKNPDSYISVLILERFLSSQEVVKNVAERIFNNFSKRIRNSPSGINVNRIISIKEKPGEIGQIAPMFDGPNPSGSIILLKDNLDKITLIDFWASWCKPCRSENPSLVKLYNKYNNKGLKVFSVSLDKTKESWVKAIEDDGLSWALHVSNLEYWQDPIAKLYNITAIPSSFIVNSEGRILAKNLRGIDLENKIKELLGGS